MSDHGRGSRERNGFRIILLSGLLLLGLTPATGLTDVGSDPYARQVQQMYVAYYGRPGDPAGVEYWAGRLAEVGGNWIADLVDAFGESAEYTERFGGISDEALIENLFQQLFGREVDIDGRAYYTDLLGGTDLSGWNPTKRRSSLAAIALDIANGAQGEDVATLDNKLDVSEYFMHLVEQTGTRYSAYDIPKAAEIVSQVTSDLATTQNAFVAVDNYIERASVDKEDCIPPSLNAYCAESGDNCWLGWKDDEDTMECMLSALEEALDDLNADINKGAQHNNLEACRDGTDRDQNDDNEYQTEYCGYYFDIVAGKNLHDFLTFPGIEDKDGGVVFEQLCESCKDQYGLIWEKVQNLLKHISQVPDYYTVVQYGQGKAGGGDCPIIDDFYNSSYRDFLDSGWISSVYQTTQFNYLSSSIPPIGNCVLGDIRIIAGGSQCGYSAILSHANRSEIIFNYAEVASTLLNLTIDKDGILEQFDYVESKITELICEERTRNYQILIENIDHTVIERMSMTPRIGYFKDGKAEPTEEDDIDFAACQAAKREGQWDRVFDSGYEQNRKNIASHQDEWPKGVLTEIFLPLEVGLGFSSIVSGLSGIELVYESAKETADTLNTIRDGLYDAFENDCMGALPTHNEWYLQYLKYSGAYRAFAGVKKRGEGPYTEEERKDLVDAINLYNNPCGMISYHPEDDTDSPGADTDSEPASQIGYIPEHEADFINDLWKRRARYVESKQNSINGCPPLETYQWVITETCDLCEGDCGILLGTKDCIVECQSQTGEPAPDECDPLTKPDGTLPCTAECPIETFEWRTGDWGVCSGDCKRTRDVWCQSSTNGNVADALCPAPNKPGGSQSCEMTDCSAYYWYYDEDDWSECAGKCGEEGKQLRSVTCREHATGNNVADSFCPADGRPPAELSCTIPCEHYDAIREFLELTEGDPDCFIYPEVGERIAQENKFYTAGGQATLQIGSDLSTDLRGENADVLQLTGETSERCGGIGDDPCDCKVISDWSATLTFVDDGVLEGIIDETMSITDCGTCSGKIGERKWSYCAARSDLSRIDECGLSSAEDSDGDGVANWTDPCPDDPTNTCNDEPTTCNEPWCESCEHPEWISAPADLCSIIYYVCQEGETYYGEACGCGCKPDSQTPTWIDTFDDPDLGNWDPSRAWTGCDDIEPWPQPHFRPPYTDNGQLVMETDPQAFPIDSESWCYRGLPSKEKLLSGDFELGFSFTDFSIPTNAPGDWKASLRLRLEEEQAWPSGKRLTLDFHQGYENGGHYTCVAIGYIVNGDYQNIGGSSSDGTQFHQCWDQLLSSGSLKVSKQGSAVAFYFDDDLIGSFSGVTTSAMLLSWNPSLWNLESGTISGMEVRVSEIWAR